MTLDPKYKIYIGAVIYLSILVLSARYVLENLTSGADKIEITKQTDSSDIDNIISRIEEEIIRDGKENGLETKNEEVQGSNNNSAYISSLTAEDYFFKAYNNESDYQYQIDNYTKCLRIYPDYNNHIVYFNRGLAYDFLGNDEEAIADYTRALRIDPDYADAYNNRGFTYNNLGEYEKAIFDYTRAIRIDPDYAEAYNNRGVTYDNLRDYEDAITEFTRAIRIDPDYADAYYNRGLAKEGTELSYCSDYKKCCDLGYEGCCSSYNGQSGQTPCE
jgi:tetratricopeptide (TPR) repeat protein